MSDRIEHLTTIILRCMTNAPNPEAGARLAAYRVTDELRKAMDTDEVAQAMLDSRVTYELPAGKTTVATPERIIAAAWDAVLEEDEP